MARRSLVACLIALIGSAPLNAQGMLSERLAEEPLFATETAKAVEDIEFCIADAISATGAILNGAYRDGPNRIVVSGNRTAEVKVFLLVTLTRTDNKLTRLEVRGRNESAFKSFRPHLERCL